jgi:hypothetical protein
MIKPLLSSGASIEQIKAEIDEWQDLIMDTYIKLKEDSSTRNEAPGREGEQFKIKHYEDGNF